MPALDTWIVVQCHLNSALILEDFLSKFFDGEEERVVVGSLDLNQCMRLPDEISGTKPEVCLRSFDSLVISEKYIRSMSIPI